MIAAGLCVALLSACVALLPAGLVPWNIAGALQGSTQFITFMMIGVIFHLLYVGALTVSRAAVFGALFFAVFVGLGSIGGRADWLIWDAAAYAIGLAIFTIAYALRTHFRDSGPLGSLGTISYSLYVVHPLVGVWTIVVLAEAGMPLLYACALACAIVLALSWLIYILIEEPSRTFGRRLSLRIGEARDRRIAVSRMTSSLTTK